MTSPEHSFDQILVKMETSLHLVEEMESILKEITGHARQTARREWRVPAGPALAAVPHAG